MIPTKFNKIRKGSMSQKIRKQNEVTQDKIIEVSFLKSTKIY